MAISGLTSETRGHCWPDGGSAIETALGRWLPPVPRAWRYVWDATIRYARLDRKEVSFVWASVNLVPARTMIGIIRDFPGLIIIQLLDNVARFVPPGLPLLLLHTRYQLFTMTAAVGLSFSVGIELIQLAMLLAPVLRRSVDVHDVILNVTGACSGYLVWRGAYALSRSFTQRSGVLKNTA